MKFKAVLAAVLGMLGISAFEKEDGKTKLTEDQKLLLTEKWGERFTSQFLKDLEAYEKDGSDASGEDVLKLTADLKTLQEKYEARERTFAEREKNLNALIETMSASSEADAKPATPGTAAPAGRKMAFSPNMNLQVNKLIQEAFETGNLGIISAATIDVTELRTEFGKYVSDQRRDILTLMFGKLQCTEYMTTKMTDKTEWQAMQSIIDGLIQKFTPYYTPSGKVKFTPLVIKNRKHKINVAIKPAEIMEDVVGYLYDEKLEPKDMPIVKYITDVLLVPKVEEERDEMLGTGVFNANANTNKTDGSAGDVGGSMDGFVTVLKALYADADVDMVRLLHTDGESTVLTIDNIYDEFDKIYLQIPKKYRNKSLPILIDPDLLNLYDRARDKKYPNLSNDNEGKRRLMHTNFTFIPLDAMVGTGTFFITPKDNFIHLLSGNQGTSKLWAQAENYDVKIFAEWWEATGFAIAELLFAYVPPTEGSASGSASGSTPGSAGGA